MVKIQHVFADEHKFGHPTVAQRVDHFPLQKHDVVEQTVVPFPNEFEHSVALFVIREQHLGVQGLAPKFIPLRVNVVVVHLQVIREFVVHPVVKWAEWIVAGDVVIAPSVIRFKCVHLPVACALRHAHLRGILTGCVTCNPDSAIVQACDHPVVAVTGPEFVTGSTRMKAGTATKLILNRLTTATMIQLGHVQGNQMVDMQLTNAKLVQRGARMVSEATGLALEEAESMLKQHGSVRAAVDAHEQQGNART